jgi:hypothetical protein
MTTTAQEAAAQHRRKVGTVRPSHLMFTGGVAALIDLPNFPVLVSGLDDWRYDTMPDWAPLAEPRLLAAVSKLLGAPVKQLRPPPWMPETPGDPAGQASRIGVPVIPFPQWLRCTACNRLAPLDSGTWGFVNDKPRRPEEAKFFHVDCPRKKRQPLAVAARFVLACSSGHLDDFPYREFVHRGGACPEASHPVLTMDDYGGNRGANVVIRCTRCPAKRNINQAMGRRGEESLPACRGRHPHLNTWEPCEERPLAIIVGASNTWFAQTLSALAVPPTGASELAAKVAQLWDQLGLVTGPTAASVLGILWTMAQFQELHKWSQAEVLDAIDARHKELAGGPSATEPEYPDLLTPEWNVFTALPAPDPNDDFTLRRPGVPALLAPFLADVVQAERLREVRALTGFTRLDAPDPQDPDLVVRAPLSRGKPEWVPASEVRGEGIFLRVAELLLAEWEARVAASPVVVAHREAFARFRNNRYSDRIKTDFDPMYGWPGVRYIALHTLSHLLIRTIALECGYSSASLSERIYAGPDRAGILIYTAVPDAEGTLGGLVSLGDAGPLTRIVDRARRDAFRCSSDPLCAERLPARPADFLHGAACHACLFVSETTCERGNRFLDRRFIVNIDPQFPAMLP